MSKAASDRRSELTEVLANADAQQDLPEKLWELVYDELRAMAQNRLRAGADTLQPTALVHETFLRLGGDPRVASKGRAYFFGAAARSMRQILVDHARKRARTKRGGGERPVTLQTGDAGVDAVAAEVLDLNRALEALEELNPRHAQIVECRYFGGLDIEETAAVVGVSSRTVKRDWSLARAWLYRELALPNAED